MIAMNRRTKIFVSKEPADMRASYDSLFEKVKKKFSIKTPRVVIFLFLSINVVLAVSASTMTAQGLSLSQKDLRRNFFVKSIPITVEK